MLRGVEIKIDSMRLTTTQSWTMEFIISLFTVANRTKVKLSNRMHRKEEVREWIEKMMRDLEMTRCIKS